MQLPLVAATALAALLITGCSRGPSQADICQGLAKELSTKGIIDSISQAKTEPGKCKALIIGDTGDTFKTIRTVEWTYTVFDDGKYTSSITNDEQSFGDQLPVPTSKADIIEAISKYATAKMLTPDCQTRYLQVLEGKTSIYTEEAKSCDPPAVIVAALENYDRAHPQPQAKPIEVCPSLAKQVIAEVEYNTETDGNVYALQLVNSSKAGYCVVSWFVLGQEWNTLYNRVTSKRIPFVVAFHYRTVGGGLSIRTSDNDIRPANAGEYTWSPYDTLQPVKL